MRKLYTILFLVLFFLNTIGYYGLLWIAERQLAKDAIQRIEKNANALTGNLILKIPLTLPYPINPAIDTRIDGEIVHDHEVYRLVKQRLYRDTLYVVCIKDDQSKAIRSTITDYVRTFTDKPSGETPGLKILISFSKDYILSGYFMRNDLPGRNISANFKRLTDLYTFTHHFYIFHPPRFFQS